MKKIFCHKLALRYNQGNEVITETVTNMIVGVEYSNMGSFGVIRWTLKEWLENHSKKDIDYCVSKGTIDYTSGNARWSEI